MKSAAILVLTLTAALGLFSCASKKTDVIDSANSQKVSNYDRAKNDLLILDWVKRELAKGNAVSFQDPLDTYAVEYMHLALKIGQKDGNFVDAYSGPVQWKTAAEKSDINLDQIADQVSILRENLKSLKAADELSQIRLDQLRKMTRAMDVRLAVVRGEAVSFDEEVAKIYDVKPAIYDLAVYDDVLAEIDALLPGAGSTADRVSAFRNSLEIPDDKLEAVFNRGIQECRNRTRRYFDLPKGEKFNMEFVSDKSWSGYNYYQGNYESLIQINTDFPIIIDRAISLGCHEGYPGHHVWNLFVESELVEKRGWIEYAIQPLFGPFGPIAEGSANYGVNLAFPEDEKNKFEREVLFPMAGLDPAKAEKLATLTSLRGKLSHATNEVARRYLDGDISREEAIPLVQKYYLESLEKSEQRVRFFEAYRGYVINYNMGRDLVETYVARVGPENVKQWKEFRTLLTRPMTASDILEATE